MPLVEPAMVLAFVLLVSVAVIDPRRVLARHRLLAEVQRAQRGAEELRGLVERLELRPQV